MVLKEKFSAVLHQTKPHFVDVDADVCEQITDDFAIGFFNWATSYKNNDKNNWNLTTKELLKIYKTK